MEAKTWLEIMGCAASLALPASPATTNGFRAGADGVWTLEP